MNPFRLVSRIVPGAALTAVADPAARGESLHGGAQQAYSVPWRVVHRGERGVIEIEHAGSAPVRAVRASLAGQGMLGLSLPRTVHPGERVRVVLRGAAAEGVMAAPDAMLVMRWFEADGTELLWPIAL